MTAMRLALFSDIHANLQALQACMAHAHAQGATQLAFLGDLVGYGGSPSAVLDTVMQAVQDGAWAVRGNHDELALHPPQQVQHTGEQGAQWTHDQLAPVHAEFLDRLPLMAQHGSVLLVHASAHQPARWPYVDNSIMAERSMTAAGDIDARIRYVFSGHVHHPSLYYRTPTAKLMRFVPQPACRFPCPHTGSGWRLWVPAANRAMAMCAPYMPCTTTAPPPSPSTACRMTTPAPYKLCDAVACPRPLRCAWSKAYEKTTPRHRD